MSVSNVYSKDVKNAENIEKNEESRTLNIYLIKHYCKHNNISSFEEYKNHFPDVKVFFKYKDKYNFYFLVDKTKSLEENLFLIKQELIEMYSYKERKSIYDDTNTTFSLQDCKLVYSHILSQLKILEYQAKKDIINKVIVKISEEIKKKINCFILHKLEKLTGIEYILKENSKEETFLYLYLNRNVDPFS